MERAATIEGNHLREAVRDRFGRELRTLRLSVTDRCNLRCRYCMPDESYAWRPGREILTFEELTRLARAFVQIGVNRIRVTGGEPLLRRDLDLLVRMLRNSNPACELCLTTNGVLLERHADALARAGLDRVTISLDSLDRETFRRMARRDLLPRVLAGIQAARQARFEHIKLNCVVVRGVNDLELPSLVRHGREVGAEVRFIEYMELAGTHHWTPDAFVSQREMLERIQSALGPVEPAHGHRLSTAVRYRCADGTTFGIIAPMTPPFCETCTRARVSADGQLYLCLHADTGFDLKSCIREGRSAEQLAGKIAQVWAGRTDLGSQERLRLTGVRYRLNQAVKIRMNERGG